MVARVLLRDVASSAALPRGVHVVGVAVALQRMGADALQLVLDDGTGLALVRSSTSSSDPLNEIRVGSLISCFGDVQTAPSRVFNMAWSRWIRAQHLVVVEDLNVETLRILDTVRLYTKVYSQPDHQPVATDAEDPFPLLPIPPAASASTPNGARRQPSHSSVSVVELQTPPSARFSASTPATAATAPSLVAPVEYQFHISNADLQLLDSGRKTLEIRLVSSVSPQ
ncbi:hypothetical protein PINS_up001880 [Pythium insidiosum]|nr:hypothetical protein PINS_up001880 [Pythium insidiosum]